MNKNTQLQLTEGLNQWQTKPLFSLPSLTFADGPHGLRKQVVTNDPFGAFNSYVATCYPTASLMACSFDKSLIEEMGTLLAKEARAQCVHVLLGPGVNIKRNPLCGRNFEYFSEDPLLSGHLGASFIKGVESLGVGTSLKHFFANNQENFRYTIDSIIDKRALREIYLKPFLLALKENPATMMTSYNKVNGIYTNEHPLLKDVVRKEWNYHGVLVSDWGAISNKTASLRASHDLEMPSSKNYFNERVIFDSQLLGELDNSVERIKRLISTYAKNHQESIDFEAHHEKARTFARESMVLLKNESILPLKKSESILFTGPFINQMRYQGSGSSLVNPYKVDQLDSLVCNNLPHVKTAKGAHVEDIEDISLLNEALLYAKEVDKVVLMMGLPDSFEAEGFDRNSICLPNNQITLLKALYEVNQNIIIVLVGGALMDLSFDSYAKGVLLAYLGGQASSSAILDILYGFSPSGRLSETFVHRIEDVNTQITNDNNSVHYEESIYVGYRYYDTFDIGVKYPFGYGLSYSSFSYNDLNIHTTASSLSLRFTVKNTGNYNTKEVIQVYISGPKSDVYKPKKELRYFDKVTLAINEEKEISVVIPFEELRYYHPLLDTYVLEGGSYRVYVSKNVSTSILEGTFFVKAKEVSFPRLSYANETYDTSDFKVLYGSELPKKHIKRKRPYTLNSTLNDVNRGLLGRIVVKYMLKVAAKEVMSLPKNIQEQTKNMLKTTPFRILALYGGKSFTMKMAEGLTDILNYRLIRGLKKLNKK